MGSTVWTRLAALAALSLAVACSGSDDKPAAKAAATGGDVTAVDSAVIDSGTTASTDAGKGTTGPTDAATSGADAAVAAVDAGGAVVSDVANATDTGGTGPSPDVGAQTDTATADAGGAGPVDAGASIDAGGGGPIDAGAPADAGAGGPSDAGCTGADGDSDGKPDSCDNCPSKPNPNQDDTDLDGVGDACDNCIKTPNDKQDDIDKDGKGNLCDDDMDGDGLSNIEEIDFGTDCNFTDPDNPDSDGDGIKDNSDVYPQDPFPPFLLIENPKGTIDVWLTNSAAGGKFAAKKKITGKDLGTICGKPDGGCASCAKGTVCVLAKCEPVAKGCGMCNAGELCRQRIYRNMSVGDFSGDGSMDFIAHTWPLEKDGTRQLWYFSRPTQDGSFTQHFVGKTKLLVAGVMADFNGDHIFDVVGWSVTKPSNISTVVMRTFLGTKNIQSSNCVHGKGCAFTLIEKSADLTTQVKNQWGFVVSRSALDHDKDMRIDIVFGTYLHGGNAPTTAWLLKGKGDGTFESGKTAKIFVHNKKSQESPVNSIVFADFDNDKLGDVALGLDDDGDAGAMWLFKGTGPGQFAQSGPKILDVNTACNKDCTGAAGYSASARTFDFDFDGKLDLVLGYDYVKSFQPPTRTVIFYGNGNGTFQKPPTQIGPDYKSLAGRRYAIPQRMCPWYP